jgi:hypothetical protein
MHDDVWTPRPSPAPAPRRSWGPEAAPTGAHGVLDASFGQLTLFFVKASLAAALALTLTSMVWLALATSAAGVGAGVYLASQSLQANPPTALPGLEGSSVAAVLAAPAPPPVAPVVAAAPATPAAVAAPAEEFPTPRSLSHTDTARTNAATDAAIRAEILRMRARRQ